MKNFILIIFLLITEIAFSCDCAPKTLEHRVTTSDNIIIAQIIKQEISWIKVKHKISFEDNPDTTICHFDIDGKWNKKYNYCLPVTVFTLKIKKEFKGEFIEKTIQIYSQYNSNCHPNLTTGFEYIFYLNQKNKKDVYDNKYYSNISECNRIELTNNFVEINNKKILEIDYLEMLKNKKLPPTMPINHAGSGGN